MRFAIDFDGTLRVDESSPYVAVPLAIETCIQLKQAGHTLYLWTVRGSGDANHRGVEVAVEWCQQQGLTFDGVNVYEKQPTDSPKMHCDIYIDDRALGCPLAHYQCMRAGHKGYTMGVNWRMIRDLLVVSHNIHLPEVR